MKKGLVLTVLSVLVGSAVCGAFPVEQVHSPAGIDGVEVKVRQAAAARKDNIADLQKAVITASVQAKNDIARMKEPKFSWAFQSLLRVKEAHEALRKAAPSAAVFASVEINAPFKAGWGEKLTVTQLIQRESVVLYGSLQDEFNVWGTQLAQDIAVAVKTPGAQQVLTRLSASRRLIGNMKEYNANKILQSLTDLMDAHNSLRKDNPALASLLSQEINKPVQTGFGGSKLVVSRFVNMQSVNVYGALQYELDAWARAIDKDVE